MFLVINSDIKYNRYRVNTFYKGGARSKEIGNGRIVRENILCISKQGGSLGEVKVAGDEM